LIVKEVDTLALDKKDVRLTKMWNYLFKDLDILRLWRQNYYFLLGFAFSKKNPKLPELRGLHGRSREKKKVFSA
jgi:hypothetical protein